MGSESFTKPGFKTTTSSRFVADKGPVFVSVPGSDGYWIPGSGHMEVTQTVSPYNLVSGSRQGVVTQYFNSNRRPRILPANTFFYEKKTNTAEGYDHSWTVSNSVNTGPGSSSYSNSENWSTNVFQYGSAKPDISAWQSKLVQKATANLLKGLRASSFNAAQAVAERKQTANLVASTATRVAGALLHLRRGNFSKAAQKLGVLPKKRAKRRFNSQYIVDQSKAVGNAWLELQYGWKPLLSDVYGSMETLATANNPPSGNPNTIYKKATGRARRIEDNSKTTKTSLPSDYSGYQSITRQGLTEMSVRTGVTYSVSSAPLKALASVGISNPLLLAWELIPYSFVVDWFLPVGNYLESLDAAAGLNFHSGYVTVFTKFKGTTYASANYSYNQGAKNFLQQSWENYDEVTMTRSVLGGFPSAPFPRFKNPLSTSHVASAMSLLIQLKR